MRSRWIAVLLALAGVSAVAFTGRNLAVKEWRARELVAMVPGLDRELALHVVGDADPEWIAYCHRVGLGPLGDALQTLGFELRTVSYPEFLKRRQPVEDLALRVAQGFTQVFDFPLPELVFRRYMAMSPEQDYHLRQLERRYIEVAADTLLSPDERIRIVDGLVDEFTRNGDPNRATLAYLITIRSELEAGRPDQHRARLETALRMARRCGQVYAVCQLLGELGAMHGRAGHEDSLRACLDEGIAVALRHGLLDHAARMLKFYATFDASRGRLALALDRLAEAQRLCEQPGGDSARLRLQIEYTKFVADLGCWDLVDRSLRRVPPLLRQFPRIGREPEFQKHAFDAERLRARLAFATGHPDQGTLIMRSLSRSMPVVHRRVGFGELYDDWSEGLEKCGRRAEALEVCNRGIAHCDSAHVPEYETSLQLRRFGVLEELGRLPEAEVELAQVESVEAKSSESNEHLDRDIGVLRARLLFSQGHVDEAKHEIRRVFREFRKTLREGDSGPLSYLELDDAVSLRDAVHEIERFTPEQGYDFELEWRELTKGAAGDRDVSARSQVGMDRPSRRDIDGTHLVYRFTGDVLLRWTATSAGVVLDTIPMSATRCLDQVREALDLLQSETPTREEFLGPKTLHSLEPLAAALLSASVMAETGRPRRIYVSADGPLLALPFESLPVSVSGREQPLVLGTDVAYVRGWASRAAAEGGPPVIVSNPTLSAELLRRHGWDHGLAETAAESQAAQTRWPNAVVLSGPRATRDAIIRSWPGASIIYLAAHHVRDGDAPFLGYVPVAAPSGAPSGAAFLEVADVQSMDLSTCRLAILASCASGVPYRMATRPGVSLGDAVLDAGAHAVVQSFWDVGDLETREFMKAFLTTWRENGDDAAALNQARRQIMATGAAPRVWAAWSLNTTLPTLRTTYARAAVTH